MTQRPFRTVIDTVIRNALVFDGLGRAPENVSVAIKDGIVTEIAPRIDVPAAREIDAAGLWLTPGFIDIHTHYDLEVEVAPGLAESVRHGVTTVLMGNCSLSIACGMPSDLADVFQRVETLPVELIRQWLEDARIWGTVADYLHHIDSLPLGPNVAVLLGHSALRLKVMGLQRAVAGPASPEEIAEMRRLTDEALDAGFLGLSVDMVYWHRIHGAWAGRSLPSHHASFEEYSLLADACRERDAVFQVTPNPVKPRSMLNILRLGAGTFSRPPLRMTLLSALDLDTQPWLWRLYSPLHRLYNQIMGNNLRMQTLTDPFVIYSEGPITPLFEEFESGVELNNVRDSEDRRRLWRSAGFRQRFEEDWLKPGLKTFHRDFSRIVIDAAPRQEWVGKTIAAVAGEAGKRPIDIFMEALANWDDQFVWVSAGANNRAAVRQKLMSHPQILPGFTDAGAHSRNLAYFDGAISLLRQAVQTGFMTPERAIERITGEPARWLNLDAGVIAVGRHADLLLIDPRALLAERSAPVVLNDPALAGAKRRVIRELDPPVRSVFVGGRQLVDNGEPLPELGRLKAGRLLRPRSPILGAGNVRMRYRNRIDDLNFDHGLVDYWEIFVMKHQHQTNVLLHVTAVFVMYGSCGAALITMNPWFLAGVFLSNLLGQYGHTQYERTHVDGRDALFSWRALAALTRMALMVIRGSYQEELLRVRSKVRS